MRWLVLSLLLASMASGCTDLLGDSEDPPCISSEEAVAVFEAGQSYADALVTDLEKSFVMQMAGTLEGEVDAVTLAYNAGTQAALLSSSEGDLRFRDGFYAITSDEGSFYGRNLDPEANAEAFLRDAFEEEDLGVEFADDIQASQYTATCTVLGERDAVEFVYERGEMRDVVIMERNGLHRPLSGESIDPALQDNFRFSFSYDRPTIEIDTSLDRIWLTVGIELLEETYAEEAYEMSFAFTDDTEWADLSELDFAVVDEVGDIWDVYEFKPGAWEIDEGDYEFRDRDGNGLLSAGDDITVGLLNGFDWTLWDEWAESTVDIVA